MVPAPSLALIVDDLLLVSRIEPPLRGIGGLFLLVLLLRIVRRQRATPAIAVVRLLLIDLLALIVVLRVVTEQEFDEAAAHVGALGRGGALRCRLRRLVGISALRCRLPRLVGIIDHRFGARRPVDRHRVPGSRNQQRRAGQQRERHFLHRRTLYCFVNRMVPAANNGAATRDQ
jgi:hypothetical protein